MLSVITDFRREVPNPCDNILVGNHYGETLIAKTMMTKPLWQYPGGKTLIVKPWLQYLEDKNLVAIPWW